MVYEKLKDIACSLKKAEENCIAIDKISNSYQELTINDAYEIQKFNILEELSNGNLITGKKIGLTSKVVQKALGVDQPDFGHLLKSMRVQNNTIEMKDMLQPKVEGEIAFVLKEDLVGPNITEEDVLNATAYVSAAIEIVDSRISNWDITIVDTVADNASSGMYILGDKKINPKSLDLKNVEMSLYKNDELLATGLGSAALGDPVYCVTWLANTLWEYGVTLNKGEVILSGALAAMLEAEQGCQYRASFSELGDVSVSFV